MSDFFDNMFRAIDLDYRQNREIEDLRIELANSSLDHASRRDVVRLTRQVEQLQLLNRALVDVLLKKGVVTEAELSVMTQQIDLLDGVEDGRISEKVHTDAPTCGTCGRFVNARRTSCVYCGADRKATAKKAPPVRMVTCSSCDSSVAERSTYYSDAGVVCGACFSG